MVHAAERTVFSGPSLIRLLARFTDVGLPASTQPLADRLGQWLGWTDAIALSTALAGHTAAAAPRRAAAGPAERPAEPAGEAPDDAYGALCARVRTTLVDAIARDATLAPHLQRERSRARLQPVAPDTAPPDYAVYRQCYLALQEEMDGAIGRLRGRLRGLLAERDPAMARLAAVDAVMERVLGAREHNALAAVPGLLGGHFERLRARSAEAHPQPDTAADPGDAAHTAAAAAAAADAASPPFAARVASGAPQPSPHAWLDGFRKDMQSVLRAELEIRFQPVEGLLAALRSS